MRNLPIPIDTTRLTFVCVSPPRPRLVDQNTGEVKTDRNGHTVYAVGLSAADDSGRAELVSVNTSGEPGVSVGQIVNPVDLVAFAWEQTRGGELRWGISYRATQILPATPNPGLAATDGRAAESTTASPSSPSSPSSSSPSSSSAAGPAAA